jgi:hypothetical protein
MVSKGLAGAAAFAMALASTGAFAPGTPFVRSPLSAASYGIVAQSPQVRRILVPLQI